MGHNAFLDGSDKRICLQCRRCRRHGFDPRARKIPKGGNSNPLHYPCLENPMDKGAWWATVHGVARIRHDLMTKPPPPPVSLPGKSTDRGAWWATVYRVAKSQTRMSNWEQWYSVNQGLWLIQSCTLETQKKKKEANKIMAYAGCLEAAVWGPQTSQWKPGRAGKVTRCYDSSQRLPLEGKGRQTSQAWSPNNQVTAF